MNDGSSTGEEVNFEQRERLKSRQGDEVGITHPRSIGPLAGVSQRPLSHLKG
jgi:hypothetical protein